MIGRARRRWVVARVIGLLALMATTLPLAAPVRAYDYANAAFRSLWAQTDADGSQAPVWGPLFSDGVGEAYVEAPGGVRAVQYFDKGRMELTNPTSGKVSAGLLASEMIKGFIQTGDAATMPGKPANLPIAGDPDNTFPTYASLAPLGTPPGPGSTGPITRLYNQDGSFGTRQEAASDPAAAYATTDAQTGHTLPRGFADFRNDPRHPLATIGLAITEPVWAKVKVGGVLKDVMIQAFERRVLTYTPANPDPYKVEFGNIGQHYYKWRYVVGGGSGSPSTGSTGNPSTGSVLPIFQPAVSSQFNPGLGKPTSDTGTTVTYSLVLMEHGIMLYVNPTKKIYALPSDGAGSVYDDPFANQPIPSDLMDCTKPGPTAGTFEPCRGFGKVWRDNASVKAVLGYAVQSERGIAGQTQPFENGFVFYDQEKSRTWMVNTTQFFARYFPVS
jgi:hypothetical protein